MFFFVINSRPKVAAFYLDVVIFTSKCKNRTCKTKLAKNCNEKEDFPP